MSYKSKQLRQEQLYEPLKPDPPSQPLEAPLPSPEGILSLSYHRDPSSTGVSSFPCLLKFNGRKYSSVGVERLRFEVENIFPNLHRRDCVLGSFMPSVPHLTGRFSYLYIPSAHLTV